MPAASPRRIRRTNKRALRLRWESTMSRILLRAVALIAAVWTVSAQAADLPYGSRAPYTVNQPLNAYSWAGPYLGANLGYALSLIHISEPTRRTPISYAV